MTEINYVAARANRVDMLRGFDVEANSDIVSGYRFCATIQMRIRRVHVHMHHVRPCALVVAKARTGRVHVHMHHVVLSAVF